jgi:hypothetical protein
VNAIRSKRFIKFNYFIFPLDPPWIACRSLYLSNKANIKVRVSNLDGLALFDLDISILG